MSRSPLLFYYALLNPSSASDFPVVHMLRYIGNSGNEERRGRARAAICWGKILLLLSLLTLGRSRIVLQQFWFLRSARAEG